MFKFVAVALLALVVVAFAEEEKKTDLSTSATGFYGHGLYGGHGYGLGHGLYGGYGHGHGYGLGYGHGLGYGGYGYRGLGYGGLGYHGGLGHYGGHLGAFYG